MSKPSNVTTGDNNIVKTTKLVIPIFFLAFGQLTAQNSLPVFLEGTWKMENREVYEQWKVEEDGSLKGESYRMHNGEKVITEYLEIRKQEDVIVYTATVMNQNEGKSIDFKLNRIDSLTWSFENRKHDFPKVIRYQKRSDSEIYVQVSDGRDRGFAFVMKKFKMESRKKN